MMLEQSWSKCLGCVSLVLLVAYAVDGTPAGEARERREPFSYPHAVLTRVKRVCL